MADPFDAFKHVGLSRKRGTLARPQTVDKHDVVGHSAKRAPGAREQPYAQPTTTCEEQTSRDTCPSAQLDATSMLDTVKHARADRGDDQEAGAGLQRGESQCEAATSAMPSGSGAAGQLTVADSVAAFSGEALLGGLASRGNRVEVVLAIIDSLVAKLRVLSFQPPVTHVYNPMEYAREPLDKYVRRYGGRQVEAIWVGMNPGPFGMAQTGIPFGDPVLVRDFLQISGKVKKPSLIHPKRPVYGCDCPRREVSGQRLWGWAKDRFGSADAFTSRVWVWNYCPLVFMEASGKNRTPNQLPRREQELLCAACDDAFVKLLMLIKPKLVVGVGAFARQRADACVQRLARKIKVGTILHPSPANPMSNNWAEVIQKQLKDLEFEFPM
eukprot:SM000013S26484  [mRNA]  locus=s13:654903:657525:- [translate_table: standard]